MKTPTNYNESSRNLYRRLVVRSLITLVLILLLIYVFWPTVMILSPLIVAAILANALSPLINKIYAASKCPRPLQAIILLVLIIALIGVPIYFLTGAVIRQVQALATNIEEPQGDLARALDKIRESINLSRSKDAQDLVDRFINTVVDKTEQYSQSFANNMVRWGTNVVKNIAQVFLWIFTFFIALYFFLADNQQIKAFLQSLSNRRIRNDIKLLKDSSLSAVGRYLRGTLYLGIYCFFFMLIAFLLMKSPYPVVIAFVFAILDILPVVGALTALVPWCIIDFILGYSDMALYLAIIIAIYYISRKAIEPKIMGEATDLHPLTTLACMYGGMKLWGVAGAIFTPIVAMILTSLYQVGLFDDWILDLHELFARLRIVLHR